MEDYKFVKYCLTDQQVKEYRTFYQRYISKTGRKQSIICYELDRRELIPFLQNLGFLFSEKEINELMKCIGLEDKDTFRFHQIVQIIGRREIDEQIERQLQGLFQFFDVTKQSRISSADLKQGMKRLKEKLKNEEIDRLMNEYDLDGDGYLNYEEFIVLMLSR